MSTRAVTYEEYRALLAEVLKLRRQMAAGLTSIGSGAPSGPSATVAALDGTGAAGSSSDYSRGDHKHADANRPTDDEKAALAGTGTPGAGNTYVTEDTLTAAVAGLGDVVGPASAVDDRIATYDGVTGKLIQDGGYSIADLIALIPAPGAAVYCEPLTDGDLTQPELIFASGDVVMVCV
jgi:hypothetical protein